MLRGQPKQGLKGGHRRPPSVEPKDEFVEVVREMFGAHAMMGAPEPCLEVREDAMNAGKQPRRIRGHALGFRAVVVAPSPEALHLNTARVYRLRVLGQWFDGIRFYAAASSPRRSRRTWAGLR